MPDKPRAGSQLKGQYMLTVPNFKYPCHSQTPTGVVSFIAGGVSLRKKVSLLSKPRRGDRNRFVEQEDLL